MVEFISLVAPVYNQEKTIVEFLLRADNALRSLGLPYEIIIVDDGSQDKTYRLLRQLQKEYPALLYVRLIKNFGQSNAIAAGLTQAQGDYIVIMDSDLQDKPEDIEALFRERQAADMIIARRVKTNPGFWRDLASIAFFQFSQHITKVKAPPHAGVFRLIKRECLADLKNMLQHPGTILSQLLAAGFSWETIPLERDEKKGNNSSYTLKKMLYLALSRLVTFCRLPLPRSWKNRFIPHFEIREIMREQ